MPSATSRETSPITTPMRPRITRPCPRNCSCTRIASSIGIANEMPANEPDPQTQIRLSGAVEQVINPIGPPIVVKAAQSTIPHGSLGPQGGGTAAVDPRDQQGVKAQIEPFEVVMKLDNSGEQYMPGQRAYIRFTVDRQPVIAQIWRKFEQLLMMRNLTNPWK